MLTRRPACAGLVTLGLIAARGRTAFAQESGTVGTWTGVLSVGPAKLRLRLQILPDGTAVLDSLDQGGSAPGRTVGSLDEGRVEVEFTAIGARYAGQLVSGNRLDGNWSQGGPEMPLSLLRGDAGLPKDGPPLPSALPAAAPLDRDLLERLRQATGSPGLAAAAQKQGGQSLALATGVRRVGSRTPVELDDKWHLGSITKSMTATLVAKLVEEGVLDWNDTVGTLLGGSAPNMRPEYRAVTLRHLASHRAGLPKDIPLEQLNRFSRDIGDARQERLAYAKLALAMAPVGPAGETFEYANNGYVVLGAIIEARLGKSWEVAIRERLFDPLKLTSAGFGPPDAKGAAAPSGHAIGPDGTLHAFPAAGPMADNPVALGPAGRVHMSMQDLLVYLAAHRDQSALLAAESWKTLHTPPFGGDYALGWMISPNGMIWHGGSNTLWYALAGFNPARGLTVATATNDGRIGHVAPMMTRVTEAAVLAIR